MKLQNKIKNNISKVKSNLDKIYLTALTVFMSLQPQIVYGSAGNIQGKITNALNQVQTVLTGLIVTVGIIVTLFIIIKRMPSADDPQEKNEVYKAVGRVLGLVAIGAAVIWIVPWIYSLFQ